MGRGGEEGKIPVYISLYQFISVYVSLCQFIPVFGMPFCPDFVVDLFKNIVKQFSGTEIRNMKAAINNTVAGSDLPVSGNNLPVAGIKLQVSGINLPIAGINLPVSGNIFTDTGMDIQTCVNDHLCLEFPVCLFNH